MAEDYARNAGRTAPTASNPAYVYEIDIQNPAPAGVTVIDPVNLVASQNANPLDSLSYHHNGNQAFLLGVVDPSSAVPQHVRVPLGLTAGVARAPNLTLELETMVRALRDAEVLVLGNLPQAVVINRHDVY